MELELIERADDLLQEGNFVAEVEEPLETGEKMEDGEGDVCRLSKHRIKKKVCLTNALKSLSLLY